MQPSVRLLLAPAALAALALPNDLDAGRAAAASVAATSGQGPAQGRRGAQEGGPAKGGKPEGPASGRAGATEGAEGPARPRLPEPELQVGSYPWDFPPARDVVAELGFAHQDEAGGCGQTVLTVSGAPPEAGGGFAAVFQDERKGNIGLFVARLDAEGQRLGAQLPVADQVGSARELWPRVAAGPDGSGAVAWLKMSGRSQAHLRLFDADPEAWSPMLPLQSRAFQERAARGRAARGRDAIERHDAPTRPDVARAPDGRYAVVWREGERVFLRVYGDGGAETPAVALNPDVAPASSPPRIALDARGGALVVWDSGPAIAAARAGAGAAAGRAALRAAGPGSARALALDPRGGFWLLVEAAERLLLRHLGPDGARDRDDVDLGPAARAADVATWAFGLVVATDRGDGDGGRAVALELRRPDGGPAPIAPVAVPASTHAEGVLLAGEGPTPERLLVAWNDDRERNDDVFHAFLSRGPDGPVLGEEQRWNDDEASSHQVHGTFASIGSRAVVAWTDERASAGHVFFRRIAREGSWAGDEQPVGAGPDDREVNQRRPAAAMEAEGRFLVAWIERRGRTTAARVRAQAFAADATPLGEPFDVDPGFEATLSSRPAVAALDAERGYVLAWVREGTGPMTRRVSLTGETVGAPWRLSDRAIPSAEEVELEVLTPRSLVCVWDEAQGARRVLTGRLLGDEARPAGAELGFAFSDAGGDLDPQVCATGDGGFLMAWTARDGPPRDVFARFFGPDGRPTGLPLGISTVRNEQDYCDVARLADGSYVVVWEDDLTGVDRAVGRRIAADRVTLGPVVTVDPGGGKHIELRSAPQIAPLGEGFVATWADHAASRGVDVVVRALGPAFDRGLPPTTFPEEGGEGGAGRRR